MQLKPVLFCALAAAVACPAQTPTTADQVADRAIAREQALLSALRATKPVAETYIQDMVPNGDFGAAPTNDHYFLGRVDLSRGLARTSYIPGGGASRFDLLKRFFSIRYLPGGFAQMMLIDAGGFDREHYTFEFVRREFLGDVRTIVLAVTPRKNAGTGRFVGDIWVEDKDFNIVRFSGAYNHSSAARMYFHFDSWRINAGPDLWLPFEVYSQESHLAYLKGIRSTDFKALTKFWGYGGAAARAGGELTDLTIDQGDVQDQSTQAADPSPVQSLRAWQRLSEDNVLDRLERAGLISRPGGIDKVLDTVLNNVEVTNNLNPVPAIRARVLLTTPLESFTIGRTIVISRGMLDTLPDEASLAAILTHELAHILLGHMTSTDFAFPDRTRFGDADIVKRFKLTCTPAEEEAANQKAVQLLMNSPYKDKLGQAGLYLKALDSEANRLPALIKPLFGDKLVNGHDLVRMSALMAKAPVLQTKRIDQIAALPLGSHTRLDPWTDDLEMVVMQQVPLVAASEKMPFEISPIDLHLSYRGSQPSQAAKTDASGNGN